MNQIKNNRRVFLRAMLSTTALACMLVYACNKKQSASTPAETAKTYFTTLANQETPPTQQPDPTKKTRGIQPRITPLTNMSTAILWDQAIEQQQAEISYTLIPLNEEIKPFRNKDYEFFRNVIFYRDQSKKENMVIVEVLSKKGEKLGTDLQHIATTAFENKYFSRSNDIDDIDATVFFFNAQYAPDGSFQLEKGKWKPVRASFRSDLDITQ